MSEFVQLPVSGSIAFIRKSLIHGFQETDGLLTITTDTAELETRTISAATFKEMMDVE